MYSDMSEEQYTAQKPVDVVTSKRKWQIAF